MASFLGEIKRRKVFQVAAVYAVVAWLLLQVVDVVNEPLRLPEWFPTGVIVLLAIGFPIALVLSWAFDLTPEGMVRDTGGTAPTKVSGRRIEYVLLALVVAAVGWLVYRVEFGSGGNATQNRVDVIPNSVAVLPFENLSPDPDDAYFAAGVHDQIINELTKVRDLSVIARTSVMQYANAARPMPEIADELRVEMLMEGSVRYERDQVRVTAQLIDGATGTHIWSNDYDGDLAEIFAIQSDIATQIAMALEAELSIEERQRIERVLTSSSDAFSLYLRATNLDPRGLVVTPFGFGPNDELHRYLDEAIVFDPGFARAHALKALDYSEAIARERLPNGPGIEELERLAWEHIGRALGFDDEENLAYVAVANIHRMHWRATEAEENFHRALELAPNDSASMRLYASTLALMGEYDRAISLAERAVELSPVDDMLAIVHDRAGNLAESKVAIDEFMRHGGSVNEGILASYQRRLGNEDAALTHLRNAEMSVSGRDSTGLAQLAHECGLLGSRDDARRIFNRLDQLARTHHVPAIAWVRAYLGVQDYDQARLWLERIDQERNPEDALSTFSLAINWSRDPALEEQPEIAELLQKLALRR